MPMVHARGDRASDRAGGSLCSPGSSAAVFGTSAMPDLEEVPHRGHVRLLDFGSERGCWLRHDGTGEGALLPGASVASRGLEGAQRSQRRTQRGRIWCLGSRRSPRAYINRLPRVCIDSALPEQLRFGAPGFCVF